MEEPKLYTIVVDGKEYKSSSPITKEQIIKKEKLMDKSGAFAEEKDCPDCPKV